MTSAHKYPHVMMICSFISLMVSLSLFQKNQSIVLEWTMTCLNSSSISLPILLDPQGMLFIFTVTYISFNVLTFSKVYMMEDPHLQRFTHMVVLFIMSMVMLILSPNMITMLLGWDGLGITSFLLVIYYQTPRSLKSGLITLMSNRIGDCLILLSIALTTSQGHWNVMNMWKESIPMPNTLMLLLTIAAFTKSAQFPFMAWLTCAMAAPTPVSALVHSSTLVTAGVFMLIRFFDFLSEMPYFNTILLISGSITMTVPAAWAMTKKELKETIALSTMSQLGLMVTTLGMGMPHLTFFHLLTHAMFKANMFMAAGMSMFFKEHRQNFTNTRFKLHSRTIAISMVMSIASMNAMFFLAGFYSKDLILEAAWYSPTMMIISALLMVSTLLTATYSTRLYRGVVTTKITRRTFFYRSCPNHKMKVRYVNNNIKMMEMPMMAMTLTSTMAGALIYWLHLTPSDLPVAPKEIKAIGPMLTISGAFNAAFACPSNKAKLAERTVQKWILKAMSKMRKFKMKRPTQTPITTTNWMLMKIKLWESYYMMLNPRLPLTASKKSKQKPHCKQMKFSGKLKIRKRWALINSSTSFKLATPILKLSFMLEKYLDLGIHTMIGPYSAKKSMSPTVNSILNFQSNNISKFLHLLIIMTFMLLPLMI